MTGQRAARLPGKVWAKSSRSVALFSLNRDARRAELSTSHRSTRRCSFSTVHPTIATRSKMDTIVRLYAPITEHASPNAAIDASDHKDDAIALRPAAAGSSFSWTIRLLPAQRRRALRALYAFCGEVDDIADGEASHALKETLLSNWRGEIAQLYAGRPQNAVTLGLSKAVHFYGLRCHDFLAIIDGAEMKAQSDIRAPSFAQLDHYCERAAVAVGRLSMRILGEESPAGERVAAELGRALQLTNILRDLAEDAKRHRLYLPRELLHARGIFATTPSWGWRSRRFPTCVVISPYSPNAITPLRSRQ